MVVVVVVVEYVEEDTSRIGGFWGQWTVWPFQTFNR